MPDTRRCVVTVVVGDEIQADAMIDDIKRTMRDMGWDARRHQVRWHEERYDPRIRVWERTTGDQR